MGEARLRRLRGFFLTSLPSWHPAPIDRAIPERCGWAPESTGRTGLLRGASSAGRRLQMSTDFEHQFRVPGTSVHAWEPGLPLAIVRYE